jgi:Fe2+ or Zn2+ uptake regulation protein
VPQKELATSIREFISRHVRTVEQLEILLLLSKHPKQAFSVQKVYDTILSTPQSVQRWLEELTRAGLVEKLPEPDAGYRCCTDETLIAQIVQLAELYQTTPVRVIEAIYRREASAAQSFADAFKITKPDPAHE